MKLPCGCEFDEATKTDNPCERMRELVKRFLEISENVRIEALFGTPKWQEFRDALQELISHSGGLPERCTCGVLLEGGATVHAESCVFYPYSYQARVRERATVVADLTLEDHKTVHILRRGFALCGFSNRIPQYWPDGHLWIGADESGYATCAPCLGVLAEERRAAKELEGNS